MQTTKLAQQMTAAERDLSELHTIRHSYQIPRSDRAALDRQIARAEQRRNRCKRELQSIAHRSFQTFAELVASIQTGGK